MQATPLLERQNATLQKLEPVLAVIGLMFFAGVFSSGLAAYLPGRTATLLRYGTMLATWALMGMRWRATLYILLQGGWVLALCLLVGASFLWAENPAVAFQGFRSEVLPMFSLSVYFAARFNLKQQFQLIAWALGLALLLSALLVLVAPSAAIHQSGPFIGAWKGVFIQKNDFGGYATLAATFMFLLANYQKQNPTLPWLFFGFCVVVILFSASKTALVFSIFAILLSMFYIQFRWVGKRTLLLGSLAILIVGGITGLVISTWEPLLSSLGRDPTLSNRTPTWTFLINEKIPSHALLGYGRGVFWSSPRYSLGIVEAIKDLPAHAHNGFIDLVLDVGLIGLFLFTIAWSVAYGNSLRLAYRAQEPGYLWPSVYLVLLLLLNITESRLTYLANLYWVLFVSTALTLNQRHLYRQKLGPSTDN